MSERARDSHADSIGANEEVIDDSRSKILSLDSNEHTNWTLDRVASIGDLPKDPTNADLVEYAIRNGLLHEGGGIRQLVERAEKFDPMSANILRAVVDANTRRKKGKGLAVIGTMKPQCFSNDPRRRQSSPRKFLDYAKGELNDMMGAWVMTRFDDKIHIKKKGSASDDIYAAVENNDKQAAKEIFDKLGESGIRRALVSDATNHYNRLDDRRHTIYYWEEVASCGPFIRIKKLAEEANG